jgi:hypothetical protein
MVWMKSPLRQNMFRTTSSGGRQPGQRDVFDGWLSMSSGLVGLLNRVKAPLNKITLFRV